MTVIEADAISSIQNNRKQGAAEMQNVGIIDCLPVLTHRPGGNLHDHSPFAHSSSISVARRAWLQQSRDASS
jgi:hypothetical protein